MVPTKKKKVTAYICGFPENIKGEMTSSKPANLNAAVRMAQTLMEQKIQARAERVVEVERDVVTVCGKKVVNIPYKNKMLVVKGDRGASRLKVISCIKARKHPEVSNTTIQLLLFPFSLEGEAQIWLDKEPPRSILTWEDLVSKFINQFFPPSKTTYLQNEITNFLQKPNETFNEAWEHFKDLLRQCPHRCFSKLHQLDTFYNALNPNDQDALDFAAGGNFLDKIPRECLSIIESKSKVRYSRSRVTNSRANTNAPLSSSPSNSFDLQQIVASLEDKLDIRMNRFEKSLNDMKILSLLPLHQSRQSRKYVSLVELITVIISVGLTRGNDFPVFHDNIQQFQTAAVGNFIQDRNQNVSNQMRPPGFNQSRFQGNNFNLNQNRQNNQGAVYQNRPQQALNYQAPAQQNTVTHSKFEAYTNANDANINNLQLKFDNFQKNQQQFQKKFEQKQDDFQNQMMNFMQNLYNNIPSSSSSLPSNTIPNPKG
nr:hypothetical protein [Tanacetum cinerariifolium]